jgi:hypothetical protein
MLSVPDMCCLIVNTTLAVTRVPPTPERYGESEGLLAKVFKAAEALGGAIIFIVSTCRQHSCEAAPLLVVVPELAVIGGVKHL